jgi:hypothetical protein
MRDPILSDRLPSFLASPFYEEGMTGDDVLFFELSHATREATETGELTTHQLWGVLDALRDHLRDGPAQVSGNRVHQRLFARLSERISDFVQDGSCDPFEARGVLLLLLDCEIEQSRQPLGLPRA